MTDRWRDTYDQWKTRSPEDEYPRDEPDDLDELLEPEPENETMANEIEKAKPTPPATAEADRFLRAVEAERGFEPLLKYVKGQYLCGNEEVPLGTEYIAHAIGFNKTWIKFLDGVPVKKMRFRALHDERPPLRYEIKNDQGEIDAEDAIDTETDPWSMHYEVPFENKETGEVAIFGTRSFGGRRAVSDLVNTWAKRLKRGAPAQPIVKLRSVMMPTKRGPTPRPYFEIVGYSDNAPITEAPDVLGNQNEMNDEIPF